MGTAVRSSPFDQDLGSRDQTQVVGAQPVATPWGPPPRARERRRRRILPFVTAGLLAAVVGAAAYLAVDVYQVFTPSHRLPALTGRSLSQARLALAADHFSAVAAPAQYSDTVPAGSVVSEQPGAGQSLKQGATVTLVPSKGPTPRDVPNLTGMSQGAAIQRLTDAGLAARVTTLHSETVPSGQVLTWSPRGGLQPKGSTVTVTVSSGPAPRTIPQLAGETYAQAAARLTGLGLVPRQAQTYSNSVPSGQVVTTTPGPGASVPRGTGVTVEVSQGPNIVTVPDVSGDDVQQATATLQQIGLQAGMVFGPPNHQVFVTNPTAGTQVPAGTTVDLYTRP